jgi:hypothetical protein
MPGGINSPVIVIVVVTLNVGTVSVKFRTIRRSFILKMERLQRIMTKVL